MGNVSSVSQKMSEADSLMMPSYQNTNDFAYFLPLKDSSHYLNLFCSCRRVTLKISFYSVPLGCCRLRRRVDIKYVGSETCIFFPVTN